MSNVIGFPVKITGGSGHVEINGVPATAADLAALPGVEVQSLICEFFVRGKPEPAGSKTNMPRRKFPWTITSVKQLTALYPIVDANKHAAGWKKTVANVAAYNYLGQPVDEPVALELVFVVARPQGHWLTNGALSAAGQRQSRPTAKPDALKLARAVEDALTGIVYTDDSWIIYGSQYKRYQRTRDEPLGVSVRVRRLV